MKDAGSPPRLRDYTLADRSACLDVFDTNLPLFFTVPERDEFAGFLDRLPGPYYVLTEAAGRVIACGGYAVVPESRRADLCWGMVRRELHGTGVGRQLTEARLRHAVTDPAVDSVALNTSQLATGFYERLGFRITEVIPDGYAPGLDRCEMLLTMNRAET